MSNEFLPPLGLEEGVFLHSAERSDNRLVLFINDVSVDLKLDSKLWDLFAILVIQTFRFGGLDELWTSFLRRCSSKLLPRRRIDRAIGFKFNSVMDVGSRFPKQHFQALVYNEPYTNS